MELITLVKAQNLKLKTYSPELRAVMCIIRVYHKS